MAVRPAALGGPRHHPLAREVLEDLWAGPETGRDWLDSFLLLRQETTSASHAHQAGTQVGSHQAQSDKAAQPGPVGLVTPEVLVGKVGLPALVADYATGGVAMACLAAWGPTPEDVSAALAGLVLVLEAGTHQHDSTTPTTTSGKEAGTSAMTAAERASYHLHYFRLMREIRDAQHSREDLAALAASWRSSPSLTTP